MNTGMRHCLARFALSLVFAVPAMALPNKSNSEECQSFLETSHLDDLSWAMERVAHQDWDELDRRILKLSLAPNDWLSLLQLITLQKPKLVTEKLARLPMPLDHKIQYAAKHLPSHLEVVEQLAQTEDFKHLPSSTRVQLGVALVSSYNNNGSYSRPQLYSDLNLSEKEQTQVFIESLLSKNHKNEFYNQFVQLNPSDFTKISDPTLLAELFQTMVKVSGVNFDGFMKHPEFNQAYRVALAEMTTPTRLNLLMTLAESSNAETKILDLSFIEPAQLLLNRGELLQLIEKALITYTGPDWLSGKMAKGYTTRLVRSLSVEELKDILVGVIRYREPGRENSKNLEKRDAFTLWWMGGSFNFMRFSKDIAEALYHHAPLESISQFHNLEPKGVLKLFLNDNEDLSLSDALVKFSAEYPHLLPLDLVEIFWDKVQDSDVVRELLRYHFEVLPSRTDAPQPGWKPTNSLELICLISGLNYCSTETTRLKDKPGQLYSLLLDIQKPLDQPAFKNIDIAPDALNQRDQFHRFLSVLRDYFYMRGRNEDTWNMITSDLNFEKGITANNIDELTEQIKSLTLEHVQELIVKRSKSESLNFSYEQFHDLIESWGDIEPVVTLISRFSSRNDWNEEIPLLIKVFQASIEGRFQEFKFGLSDKDNARQLDMIDPSLIDEWTQERFLLTSTQESSKSFQDSSEAQSQIIKDIVSTNLNPHWIENKINVSGPSALMAKIDELIKSESQQVRSEITKTNPVDRVKTWIEKLLHSDSLTEYKLPPSDLETLIAHEILEHTVESLDRIEATEHEQIKAWSKLGFGTVIAYPHLIKNEMSSQLISDFKSLEQAIKPEGLELADDGLVFTVLTSAPKLLLTIGDLVNTSSCQNYRTGGMVHTLLGYVIDANIQALASFHLAEKHFSHRRDYEALMAAVAQAKTIEIEWNGNLKVVRFNIKGENRTIETHPLQEAHLRQMVKLGQSKDQKHQPRVGLRLEREYVQNHPALAVMKRNHKLIYDQLSQELNAYNQGSVLMKQTKNPLGVYSDLSKGVHTSDYEVR